MTLRPLKAGDLQHLETFVWQAIFPAFDREDLSPDQRAENDQIVSEARTRVDLARTREHGEVIGAVDMKAGLLGYVVVDGTPGAYAEISAIVVKRGAWGKGVAARLLEAALEYLGDHRAVSVSLRNFNHRARAFFLKHGFFDTGETVGDFAVPRLLLLREPTAVQPPEPLPNPPAVDYLDEPTAFPSAADEPVFEQLPDYSLSTEAPEEYVPATPGQNALATDEAPLFDESTLDDEQLSLLESFIAKAKRLKAEKARTQGEGIPQPTVRATARVSEPTALPATPPAPEPLDTAPLSSFEFAFEPVMAPADDGFSAADSPEADSAAPSSENFSTEAETEQTLEWDVAPPAAPAQEHRREFVGQASVAAHDTPVAQAERPSGSVPDRKTTTEQDSTSATPSKKKARKECPGCSTRLPVAARFCYQCGLPQAEPSLADPAAIKETQATKKAESKISEALPPLPDDGQATTNSFVSRANPSSTHEENFVEGKDPETEESEVLELVEHTETNGSPTSRNESASTINTQTPSAPESSTSEPNPSTTQEATSREAPAKQATPGERRRYSIADLKQDFREHLAERTTAYFGKKKSAKYLDLLAEADQFQIQRNSALVNLANWIGEQTDFSLIERRVHNTLADLTEYFIVDVAAELHGGLLPQRLLRHQSVAYADVDLFRLVMDYLDFDRESETVYTDFLRMSPRALANATKSFLHASKDEQVFFICDQSLISRAKNGFALTDAGLYWKNVLQPAGSILYTTVSPPKVENGHLDIDGQFFDAGGTLNVKMAVLLDKLRRLVRVG